MCVKDGMCTISNFIAYFSSWGKLKRCIAWILRFKRILKGKFTSRTVQTRNGGNQRFDVTLSLKELEDSESALLAFVQYQFFRNEIECLRTVSKERNGARSNRRQLVVKKSSPLRKLDPILKNGLLRVGGCDRTLQPSFLVKIISHADPLFWLI